MTHVAAGAALAALALCAAAPAARAGDINSFYDGVLQAIGVANANDGINYSERSPLVVPPNRDLPPPGAAAAAPAPNWPKDPDVMRAARAKTKEKDEVGPHPDWAYSLSLPMRPNELNVPGGTVSGRNTGRPSGPSAADYPDANPNRKNIFSLDWFKKKQYATFTGEPTRERLTDPPPGYLTPSSDQPYGIGPEHKPIKVPTVADRQEPIR